MGAGRTRFMRGPSLTYASVTNSLSTSTSLDRFSALAMADRRTFSTEGAMRLLVVRKILIASPAFWPRIKSTTSRAFWGDVRMYRASALASMTDPYDAAGAGLAVFSAAALAACPLNTRVGENSPSLCPTMFSVTYTGMNFRPLCTAKVWPINSGRMVERRDHVRTTFFSFLSFMPDTFFIRWSSTNGPLLSERPIAYLFFAFRVTIHLLVRLLLRVLKPRVGWPQGVTGWRPPLVLPSPPPWG